MDYIIDVEEYIRGAEEILRIKELYQLLLSDRPYVRRYAANKIKERQNNE
jgi:hypothetical protein